MSVFVPEKQAQAEALCLLLAQKVREYYADEEHRKKFERWYEERYGTKYEWKKVKV